MTHTAVRRRARILALGLAIGAGVGAYVALRSALSALGAGEPTSIDAVWQTVLLLALGAALCWAGTVALLARAQIERGGVPTGTGRRLAVVLLAVAGWTTMGSAGAAVPSAPGSITVATAPLSAAEVPSVPSPDFAAPTPDASLPPGCPTPPEPGWTPTAPKAIAPADGSPLLTGCTGGAPQADTTVVVRGGDTLWSIVARALGPEASPDRIARDLPAWYDANRQVIGADPDLLLPGQILTTPSAASATSSASFSHTSDSTDSTNTQGSSR